MLETSFLSRNDLQQVDLSVTPHAQTFHPTFQRGQWNAPCTVSVWDGFPSVIESLVMSSYLILTPYHRIITMDRCLVCRNVAGQARKRVTHVIVVDGLIISPSCRLNHVDSASNVAILGGVCRIRLTSCGKLQYKARRSLDRPSGHVGSDLPLPLHQALLVL